MGQKAEIKRIEKWREPFSRTVDELYNQPFEWGVNDCALGLVRKLVLAMTGIDYCEKYKGAYWDAKTAYRFMKTEGFKNVADFVESILPETELCKVKIGDVAAIETEDSFGFALGVVNGDRIIVLTEQGIGTVDLFAGKRFFKVG